MAVFDPPLGGIVSVGVPAGESSVHLCFRLQLEQSEETAQWQVWTNAGVGEWRALNFDKGEDIQPRGGDIILASSTTSAPTLLTATTTFPATSAQEISYTFRKVHPNGDITWCGNGGDNGTIRFHEEGKANEEVTKSVPEKYRKLEWKVVALTLQQTLVEVQDQPIEAIAVFASAPITDCVTFTSELETDRLAHYVASGGPFQATLASITRPVFEAQYAAFSQSASLVDLAREAVTHDPNVTISAAGSGIALWQGQEAVNIFRPYCGPDRLKLELPVKESRYMLVAEDGTSLRIATAGENVSVYLESGPVFSTLQVLPVASLGPTFLALPNAKLSLLLTQREKNDHVSEPSVTEGEDDEHEATTTLPSGFNLVDFIQNLVAYLWVILARSLPRQAIQPPQVEDSGSISSGASDGVASDEIRTPSENLSPAMISIGSFADVHISTENDHSLPQAARPTSYFNCDTLDKIYLDPAADPAHVHLFVDKEGTWEKARFAAQKGDVATTLTLHGTSALCMLKIEYDE